ncbi:hypothetical protein PENTCL1PPCAC_8123, partial [Pristionchus entomophagus]
SFLTRIDRRVCAMYTATTEKRECLICGDPIIHAHLGVDACRACAIFYKRHATFRKPLVCRRGTNDCYEKNLKPSCRQCRFVRFATLLGQPLTAEDMKAMKSQTNSNDQHSDTSDPNSEESPKCEEEDHFLDHRSFSLLPSTSHESFFDRLKRAYSMLCMIRKCGELGTHPIPLSAKEEAEMVSDGIKFAPGLYSNKIPNLKIMFASLIQFADASFDDFHRISSDSKHFIANSSFKLLNTLDSAYRSAHHFPDDDTMASGYTTYYNESTLEPFLNSCPFRISKETLEELKKGSMQMIDMKKHDFKRVNPSSEEFVAMMGLCLWSQELASLSDEYSEMVERNRSQIMSELHKMYARRGIVDYAARLGELMCLLVNIEKVVTQVDEDMEVYKLMNVWTEDFDKLRC